jgi:hypothetical protein
MIAFGSVKEVMKERDILVAGREGK